MDTEDINNKIIQVSYNFAKTIFNNININIYNKLLFTEDSIYSSSKTNGSNKLIKIILNLFNNNTNLIITDGTANIGTDSIELAKKFKQVNSIEYSSINYKALVNNVGILNEKKNIKCYKGDTNHIINSLKQDIIYIDAPWGGRNYKDFNNLKVFLGDTEILNFYLANKNKAKIFIFKIPYNYDFEYFKKYIVNKITIIPFSKKNKIKYFYIVIEN